MQDLIYLFLILAAITACVGLVGFCQRLGNGRH